MVSDRDGDGCQGSVGGNAPAVRAYGGGREDRRESVRAAFSFHSRRKAVLRDWRSALRAFSCSA